jgi:hypothetical protein
VHVAKQASRKVLIGTAVQLEGACKQVKQVKLSLPASRFQTSCAGYSSANGSEPSKGNKEKH